MQHQMQHHQQVVQQEQLGNQQQHNMVQQQMMLCPVRLVYETPYIVQQGAEQVQNQNIFINPQNPPPWARPVQNQVIYVQQLQPNVMPNMIQQMDPNQLYLQQNLANYQQLITQQMINQNSQEQRQIQMQMQIPNMMQNVQNVQAIAPNIQGIQTEMPMQIMQNYTQQQTPEVQAQTQNQINLVPDPNNANRQIVSVQTTQTIHQNSAANQKAVELQRQAYYRNVLPQQNQQQVLRPQMPLAVNQVQNMTSIQQIQQLANQNFAQNLRPAQNPVQQIIANVQQDMQPVMMNTMGMQTQTQERNVNLPNNTVTYSAVRNGQSYTFRAIQPKPPQPRTFSPMAQAPRQMPPNNSSHQNINKPPQNNLPNLSSKPNQMVQQRPIPGLTDVMPTQNTMPTQTQTYRPEQQANRKRKSQSPDEIQKKIPLNSTVYGSITVTAKAQEKFVNKNIHSQDMGVNTSTANKPQYKVEITQSPVLQVNPIDINMQTIKEERRDTVMSPQQPVQRLPSLPILPTNSPGDVKVKDHIRATLLQAEKERLARSTVFPQARGRLLNDKPTNTSVAVKVEEKPKPIPKESSDAFTQTIPKRIETKPPAINPVKPEPILPKTETKVEPLTPRIETKLEPCVVNPRMKTKIEPSIAKVTTKDEPSGPSTPATPKSEPKPEPSPKVETNPEVNRPKLQIKIESSTPSKNSPTKSNPTASLIHPQNDKPLTSIKTKTEVKENISKPAEKTEKEPFKKEQDKKELKEKKEYKNISSKDMTGKEIHIVNGNIVKEDKDFVLTHVLDGYVIQESNVPFAIRRPLKEKTVTIQAKIETEKEKPKTDVRDKPVVNERVIKDNSKILDLSHLQLNDGKVEEKDKAQVDVKEEIVSNDNPFSSMKSDIVKSWTVDQLTDHLSRNNWEETANILREHEIDGESLFLVSKSQLVTIGVNESNADIVCEFVNCKL